MYTSGIMNLKGCFYEKKVIMGGKIQEGLGRMDPAAKRASCWSRQSRPRLRRGAGNCDRNSAHRDIDGFRDIALVHPAG